MGAQVVQQPGFDFRTRWPSQMVQLLVGSPIFLPLQKPTIRKLQFDLGIRAFMESRLKGLPSLNIDYSPHCGNLVAIKYFSFPASVSFSLEEIDFSSTNVVLSVSRKQFYICRTPVVNNIKKRL